MNNHNNQDISKIYQQIQQENRQENRYNRIIGLIQTVVVIIPSLVLIWKSFRPKKLSPKQRLIRIDAAMARLRLERETVYHEALHEAELKQMETGLEANDILTTLTNKGQSLLKDQVNQVNKVVDDQLKSAKETFNNKLKTDEINSSSNKYKKEKKD